MSSVNEDRRSPQKSSENVDVLLKKNISYSRDFMLSLSNLDICKKLPSGFDESLLSEIVDASESIPELPRNPGILPLHGVRRIEYSSSPPTHGDYINHSKGTYGKRDSHSSGRSGRDSSQSDKDSDSGRPHGSQSLRSWQSPVHDGLLGSGSLRLSAHAGGTAPTVQKNGKYQNSRSNDAYHPPRPYKDQALPHIRRGTDSYNDETFGSSKSTSRDKSDEEMRRASFEVMRKEQQKVLQEKQKIMEKQKAGVASKLSEVLGDGKEERGIFGKELATSISSNHSEKSSLAPSPPVRPVVPPGFRNNVLEKGSGLKSFAIPTLSEVMEPEKGDSLLETSFVNGLLSKKTQHATLYNPEVVDLNGEISEEKAFSGPEESHSTSVVENIFGSTKSVNVRGSSSAENGGKPNKIWSPGSAQSFKFAQWFSEKDAMVPHDSSQGKPNVLLPLVVGGDKAGGHASDAERAGRCPMDFSYKTFEQPINIRDREKAISAALTCEDLEQSILSEYGRKSEISSSAGANLGKTRSHVDSNASLNLISLLQKGTDEVKKAPDSGFDINLLDNTLLISQEHDTETAVYGSKGKRKSNNNTNPGNTVTLQSFFGNAFMQELQSVEAPVSLQRRSDNSAQVDKIGSRRQYSGLEGAHEFQFPEQENLIPNSHQMMTFSPIGNSRSSVNFSSSTPIDISRKLATRGTTVKYDQVVPSSESMAFKFTPYNEMEPDMPYHRLHSPPSYHDSLANRQFSSNVTRHPFHHLNVGPADYDVPLHHSMELNIPNTYTPRMTPNLKTVLHHGNKGTGSVLEMNQMRGFPSGARPSRACSYGVPISGTSNNVFYYDGTSPEALQRLMEMELRSKEGIYGGEVKQGFRYR